MFKAKAVKKGGVVRRKRKSVEKNASVADLEAVVKRRGFHMVETGDQYVILCNAGTFRVIC